MLQLCQYEEDYPAMLRELSLASSLDPGWGAPRERMDTIWKYLKSMDHLVSTKVTKLCCISPYRIVI